MNYFSVAGKHHNYDSKSNQDAVLFKNNDEYCAMVLADGVSSCEYSKTGAEITCKSVAEFLLDHAERLFSMNEHETAQSLVGHILYSIKKTAGKNGNRIEEYSSTLACVLFDRNKNRMLYCSIGDSLITAIKGDNCYIVAMPSDSRNGCCVTTTCNAASKAKVGIIDTKDVATIMICSDGAWNLMYRRNRMQQTIKEMIIEHKYEQLKETLLGKERFDDCSFITMDLEELLRRKTA